MHRFIRLVLVLIAMLVGSAPALARSFTVDDLLRTEGFGSIIFDPSGRWLVFERLAPFSSMQRFDMLSGASVLRARLYRVDLRQRPWHAQPLLAELAPGTAIYGFSPDGERLAIGHLDGNRWRLGIVTMSTGIVRWFEIAPDYTPFYNTLAWASNDELVVIADPERKLPKWLSINSLAADRMAARWKATRTGAHAAVTVLGSGRFLGLNPKTPLSDIIMLNVHTGRRSTLASGPFIRLAISPDRKHVALVEQGGPERLPQNRPMSQIDCPFVRSLAVLDLEDRQLWHPCRNCDLLDMGKWSSDSRRLAFLARRGREDWLAASLMETDVVHRVTAPVAMHGIVPAITESADGSATPGLAWRGGNVLIYGYRATDADHRADWYVLGSKGAVGLTAGLSHVGSTIAATPHCAATMMTSAGAWCLDGRAPVRIGAAGVRRSTDGRGRSTIVGWRRSDGGIIVRGDVLPGRVVSIDAFDAIDGIESSAAAHMLVVRRTEPDGEKALILVSSDVVASIATANHFLRDVQSAVPLKVAHQLADGKTGTSWLYMPVGLVPSEKPPLVVIPYPGMRYGDAPPANQGPGAGRLQTSAQLLAGHGYAVLLPSMPEPSTAPKGMFEFAQQLDPIVDAAIATGKIDPTRVALWGHSYGGYAAALIATQTDRYCAIIASHGIYDLGPLAASFGPHVRVAPERTLAIGQFAWAETGQGRMGVLPWIDPVQYVANSPFYQAGHITTPLLIVAADRDASPLYQAEQLFSALFRQNKDAELVTYWGEGHVLGSPPNIKDFYHRVFAWLDLHLSRSDPPAATDADLLRP